MSVQRELVSLVGVQCSTAQPVEASEARKNLAASSTANLSPKEPNVNQRIKLSMTVVDAIVALAEGNPGATVAMSDLYKNATAIDPDSALGEMGPIFALDVNGIYGPRIWMLYKDVCDHDPGKVIAILRANQLGQLAGANDSAIKHAIENRGEGLDLEAVIAAVQTRLPSFNVTGRNVPVTP